MAMAKKAEPALASNALLSELRGLIEVARQHVAQTANATLTMLYWHVGQRIHKEVLKNESPRVSRRLPLLRRWSHEEDNEIRPGSARAFSADGVRAAQRA
ncbi:MAG: hypothetical protein J0L98_17525, partial [Zoogloea sp.]|nr:hypothetical protein [Zoogloea sp.]